MESEDRAYKLTPDNKVIGPEGVIYDEGDRATAEEIVAALNSDSALTEAIDAVLAAHDYPISGTQWQEIQRKSRGAIRGEES
jgi:hypothetical protein